MAPERWEVPISIVAVNRIEVTDHIDWLHNELNIYDGGFDYSCPDFSYIIQIFWFTCVCK